jgi:hypothetical protein
MDFQDNLYSQTAVELVELHNRLCPPEAKIEGQWKASKRALIAMIRKFGTLPPDNALPILTEKPTPRPMETIGALIKAMLATGSTYEEIAVRARARFPSAKTTPRSVASVACVMRKGSDKP